MPSTYHAALVLRREKPRKSHLALWWFLGATRLHHLTWKADKSPEGLQSHPQQCQVLVFGVALPLGGSFVTALQAQTRYGQCFECCVNSKSYILQIHVLC